MTLEDRVRVLEDAEAIRTLKHAYGRYIDGRDWDPLVELFTEDATCTYEGIGTFTGHDELHDLGEIFLSEIAYSCHLFLHPTIDVDGDTATGTWVLVSLIGYRDGPFEWRQGRYQDEYRRVDDEWKIAAVSLEYEAVGAGEYEFGDHENYGHIPHVE